MSNKQDDPREILALLNSLGFVGITAPQLKAFMKDLKIYKKIKERERQHRKEEIRKKILRKQQCMIQELLNEHSTTFHTSSENITSDTSNQCDDSSVQVQIVHKTRKQVDEATKTNIKQPVKHLPHNNNANSVPGYVLIGSKKEDLPLPRRDGSPHKPSQIEVKKPKECVDLKCKRPASAPNLGTTNNKTRSRSATSDQSEVGRPASLPTARTSQSRQKSFIRPWRLQPDAQKAPFKKSDPVALYQKYQQEWKQISLPGENRHSEVRWAVREKMLGTDPHPVPLSTKSTVSLSKR